MAALHQTPESSSENQDDLQQIKGIGRSTAQALNDIGIFRYADLASHTPERLAELLKTKLPSITAQRIERADWLGQARTLSRHERQAETQAAENSTPSTEDETDRTTQAPSQAMSHLEVAEAAPVLVDKEKPEHTSNHRADWRDVADFFVSFGYAAGPNGEARLQTRVHCSQTKQSARWEGVVTDQLSAWMLGQAGMPAPEEAETPIEAGALAGPLPPPEVAASVATDMVAEEAHLELSDLWVSEFMAPTPVGGRREETLRADGRLRLSGPAAFRLTEDAVPFTVELFLVDTQTNESKPVGSYSASLIPGDLIYDIRQDFPIPSVVGHFQLYIVARLLHPTEVVTHLQGPLIRVEA